MSPPHSGDWTLVFDDQFDQGSLDTDAWGVGFGWGLDADYAKSTADPDAVRVTSDDQLALDLIQNGDGTISHGGIHSKNLHEYIPGTYFETRLRCIDLPGCNTAFWSKVSRDPPAWPPEIDFMEVPTHTPDRSIQNIHYSHDGGVGGDDTVASNGPYYLDSGTFADDYHTFGCYWGDDEIAHYLDGSLLGATSNDIMARSMRAGTPFYLMLDVVAGNDGGWMGDTPDTGWENYRTTAHVEYVEVWKQMATTPDGHSDTYHEFDVTTGLEDADGTDHATQLVDGADVETRSDTRVDVADENGNSVVTNALSLDAGDNITFSTDGAGNATINAPGFGDDTHVAVENTDGDTLVSDVQAIHAGEGLEFVDDGDGTVTLTFTGAVSVTVVEDFETASPLGAYSGSTGDWAVVSAPTFNGDGAIQTSADFPKIYDTARDPAPAKGDVFECAVRSSTAGDTSEYHIAWVLFGVQDAASFYAARVLFGQGSIELHQHPDTDSTWRASSDVGTLAPDTWYTLRVTWDDGTLGGDDGELTIELHDDTGLLGSASAVDTTYTGGGIGFEADTNTAGDTVTVDYYTILE